MNAVRDAADLPGLLADYVTLKKAGQHRFKALCPFHPEKTPSFYVDARKQLFYCFGCGVGGDAFKFLMLQEKVGFLEAVRMIAVRNGIPVPASGPAGDSRDKVLYEIHEAASRFFRSRLAGETREGRAARAYLEGRGLRAETLERFQIGYAADRWDGLKEHLRGKGFREGDLLRAGLLIRKEETGHTYDRFRKRIMFPIRTLSGRCVGFGGRILGDGTPKYLNSPETAIFDKGRNLYGLDAARHAVRIEATVILVEGYLDFLSLFQAGIENVAATLGTSFGGGHAKLLRRFADRVIVNFDPDEAGSSAIRRSLEVLLERGFDVRVLRLPEGEDPDAFVRRAGADGYRRKLREAPAYLVDLIREAAEKHRGEGARGRLRALREVLPFLARLDSSVVRLSYAGPLAEALDIGEDSVLEELREALRQRRPSLRDDVADRLLRAGEAECRLVRLLIEDGSFRHLALERLDDADLEGTPAGGIIRAIRGMEGGRHSISFAEVHRGLDGEEERKLLARIASAPQPPANEQDGWGCVEALRRRRLSRELKMVQRELERGAGKTEDLLRRKMELGRQMEELTQPNPAGGAPGFHPRPTF